jgi:short-subunit dehydrogenase
MSADQVADESLRSLGTGNPVCITGAPNKLIVAGMSLMSGNSLVHSVRRAVKGMLKR